MDRLAELTSDLAILLAELREEAQERDLVELAAPLDWLDEASWWLKTELARGRRGSPDAVPFTYIPVELRR